MARTRHMEACEAARTIIDGAIAGVCNGGVIRGRRARAMAEQFSRQVHVYLDFSKAERAQFSGQDDDWATRIRIECRARTDATYGAAEDSSDDLAQLVYAALMAHPTLDLPDSVEDVEPIAIAWDTDEAETQVAVTQLAFDVKHRTAAASIAAP